MILFYSLLETRKEKSFFPLFFIFCNSMSDKPADVLPDTTEVLSNHIYSIVGTKTKTIN